MAGGDRVGTDERTHQVLILLYAQVALPQHDGELRRRRVVVDVQLRRAAALAAALDAVLAATVADALTTCRSNAKLVFFFNSYKLQLIVAGTRKTEKSKKKRVLASSSSSSGW